MGAVLAINGMQLVTDMFDDFWLLFPRKEAKKDARKAWAMIDPRDHVQVLTGVADWRAEWNRRGTEAMFIPMPATWLRAERWNDEIPNKPAHSSHVPAAMAALPERGEIPEHVKALLAKLKGR